MTPLKVEDINQQIISEIELNISQTVPLLPMAFVRVLAKAIAGAVVLIYKYTSFIFLQLFVATASSRPTTIAGTTLTPLIEHGNQVGAGEPIGATAAELTIDITVINQTGDPIPAGTGVVYEPTGVLYLTQTTILRDAAVKSVNVLASNDQNDGGGLGTIGNIPVGATVSFTQPLADIERGSIVSAVVTTGANGEDLDTTYRQRVIDRYQKRPQGGALADLEIWGEETPGIINVYPYTGLPGSVICYVEATEESSGNPDGFPTQAQLDATLASIELDQNGYATRRPANMHVTTVSITRREFTVQVVSLEADDVPATQQAISDALVTLFKSFEPFIGGLTVIPRYRVTNSEVSRAVLDVAEANNATFSSVILRAANTSETTTSQLITAVTDDARQTGPTMFLNDASLVFDGVNLIGMRWDSVNVPLGATIVSASLEITGAAADNVYSELTIRGEADASPATFTTTANDISSRTPTLNTAVWVPDPWVLDETRSVDITAIIAEIIEVPGWGAGNAMALTVSSLAGSDREAFAFDGDPAKAARLTITYSAPSGAFAAQDVVALGEGEKAKLVLPVTF